MLCNIISNLGIDQGALLSRVVGVGAYNHCMSASGHGMKLTATGNFAYFAVYTKQKKTINPAVMKRNAKSH